jgi:hypothetical protein
LPRRCRAAGIGRAPSPMSREGAVRASLLHPKRPRSPSYDRVSRRPICSRCGRA